MSYNSTHTGPEIDDAISKVEGVTSNIQEQLDEKVNLTGTQTITGQKTFSNILLDSTDLDALYAEMTS